MQSSGLVWKQAWALYFRNYIFISAYKIFFYSVSKILSKIFCLCYWISLPKYIMIMAYSTTEINIWHNIIISIQCARIANIIHKLMTIYRKIASIYYKTWLVYMIQPSIFREISIPIKMTCCVKFFLLCLVSCIANYDSNNGNIVA